MKLIPGKKYTRSQLKRLMDQSTANELQLKGYVLRMEPLEGTYSVVHWTQAGSGADFGTLRSDPRGGTGYFEPLDPIKKRTPMERVDSLMLRLIEDCKQTGTVPGLDDARIKLITGEAWKTGRSEVTGEVVRAVAAEFLAKAEKESQLAK